jgi:hypothetical protein
MGLAAVVFSAGGLFAAAKPHNPAVLAGWAVATVLLLVPVMRTLLLYYRQPVLVRSGGCRLLPRHSGRTLLGRILGGDSRVYGFVTALAGLVFLGVQMLSFALAAVAGSA